MCEQRGLFRALLSSQKFEILLVPLLRWMMSSRKVVVTAWCGRRHAGAVWTSW